MTRKDYELIATEIRRNVEAAATVVNDDNGWIGNTARCLAIALRSENHRFDAHRFLTACGLACAQCGETTGHAMSCPTI